MNLRDELGGLAGQAPSYASGEKALKTAKRRRAVKMTAAPLAAVAALAVAIPLALQNIGGGGADDGAEEPARLDTVEYITSGGPNGHDVLHTAGGQELEVPAPFTGVRTVLAVPDGWVLGANGNSRNDSDGDGIPDGAAAGFLDRNGEFKPLTGQDGTAVINAVSADGSHIAWLMPDDTLHVAELGPSGAEAEVVTPVEPGVDVLAWSGDLLAVGQSPNDLMLPQRWDVWDPQSGDFEPDWTEGVLEPIALPDERVLVSVRENEDGCLAYVNTRGLDEIGRRCPDFPGRFLAASNDGEWLYASAEYHGGMGGLFIDLDRYFAEGSDSGSSQGGGIGQDQRADWTPAGTLIIQSGNRLDEYSATGESLDVRQLPEGARLVLGNGV